MRAARRRAAGLLLAAALLSAAPAAAQPVPEGAALVLARGGTEVRVDAAFLARLAADEQEVGHEGSRGPVRGRFRGVPLWAALQASGVIEGMGARERIRRVLRVTGRDGHTAAVALAEVDPDFGGKPALLAWAADGTPLPDGGLRLALPGDRRGARSVRDVVRIALE